MKPVVDLTGLPEEAMWAEWDRAIHERPEFWKARWKLRDFSFQTDVVHGSGPTVTPNYRPSILSRT